MLDNLSSPPSVTSFVVDFETGMWNGLRSVFDNPVIHGCAFHFGQALWRKVQEKGLQVSIIAIIEFSLIVNIIINTAIITIITIYLYN